MVVTALSVFTRPKRSSEGGRPFLAGAQVDSNVLAILTRSCADCHSEDTRYPWYSYVAPVSWLINDDVSEGRIHLNLSKWNDYSLQRKQRILSEIANQVKDREMPLRQYTLLHPGSALSEADINAIFQWTQNERARLITESLIERPTPR